MTLFGIPITVLLDMTITACMTVWSPGPNNILLLSNARFHVSDDLVWIALPDLAEHDTGNSACYEVCWSSIFIVSGLRNFEETSTG